MGRAQTEARMRKIKIAYILVEMLEGKVVGKEENNIKTAA
jgi:hypothetical protein